MRVIGSSVDEAERLDNTHSVWHFAIWAGTEYALRFYPQMEGLPGMAIRLLGNWKDFGGPAAQEFLACR